MKQAFVLFNDYLTTNVCHQHTMKITITHSWRVLCIFVGLSIVMRFFSFFPSVIDHDESTYILIAEGLLSGQVYWRDLIDTKPIGIFLLFAIFQFAFGKTIIMVRVMAALWVAMTAWMLYLVHKELIKSSTSANNPAAPIATGVIYIFLTSIFTFYGVSPNTELFFVLFSITALYLILKKQGVLWFLFAGIILGLGFMIKYVVLFDGLAIGLFYLWHTLLKGKNWSYWLPRCMILGIGFLIPITLSWCYYLSMDMIQEFNFYTFSLSGRYFVEPSLQKSLLYLLDFFLRYFPISFFFFYAASKWRITGKALPILACLWGLSTMIIILLPGKLFGHYLIQFMVPFSLLAGSFFDPRINLPKPIAWVSHPKIGYPILILIILVNIAFQKKDYFDKRDFPREISSWLNQRLKADDILYTSNYQQIVYFLTDKNSPTPYVHGSLIWNEEHNYALKFDPLVEWAKILAQKPKYILLEKKLLQGTRSMIRFRLYIA